MNNSIKIVLIIFAGSGLGGVARYAAQLWVVRMHPFTFPLGTFLVNTIGCFLIGLFYAFSEKGNLLTPEWRLALTTGFCGGFTTFSSFSLDAISMFERGELWPALLYIATSVVVGIAALYGGLLIVRGTA